MGLNAKRAILLVLNLSVFTLCYLTCNDLAQQHGVTRNVALQFESAFPFIQWMILPYLSSGILFVLGFILVQNDSRLSTLSQRLLLAGVVACLIFSLVPLRFSFTRPTVTSPFCHYLFELLNSVDQPYNQLPSLHVAYCVIIWASIRTQFRHFLSRVLFGAWILLVCVSTLFTFQHHLMDVIAGALLGIAAIKLLPQGESPPRVGFYYLLASGIVFITLIKGSHMVFAWYLLVSFLLVSLSYFRRDNNFLNKKNGQHPWISWLLYAPYLFGYWLTWLAVQYKEKRKPAFYEYAHNLWIGRRLTSKQADTLPANCVVIDVSNELSETVDLATHRYYHFPMLDLIPPDRDRIATITATIAQELDAGNKIYLHCAMGYSRCILIAEQFKAQRTT